MEVKVRVDAANEDQAYNDLNDKIMDAASAGIILPDANEFSIETAY
jgi:hypothetical protein